MAKTNLAPLTKTELSELAQHEAVIERGQRTFLEVGIALATIKEGKLYRADFKTFEDYCRGRWGLDRRRAYQMLEAAAVVENVQNFTQIEPPQVESQARALADLPAEQQAPAWEDAVELAAEREQPVTAAVVEEVVQSHLAQSEPYREPEDEPEDEPEPPKSDPVKDAKGNVIPEKYREVFTRGRAAFAEALNLEKQLMKAMNAIAADEVIGVYFAAKAVNKEAIEHLNQVRRSLRFAAPFGICPYCKGGGVYQKKQCPACYGLGWVTEAIAKSGREAVGK
jgi:hypothetical protein